MKKFTLDIPIIPVKLHLIITKDIINERMKMVYEFGPVNTNAQMLADALCSYGIQDILVYFLVLMQIKV